MKMINIHEAKTQLSKLIEEAEGGMEIVIARAGKPAVKLVPYKPVKPDRKPGSMKGKLWISDDFNDPLPDDILAYFEGRSDEDPA